jgi:hypothetical protein
MEKTTMADGKELAELRDAIEFAVDYENSRKVLTLRLDALVSAYELELSRQRALAASAREGPNVYPQDAELEKLRSLARKLPKCGHGMGECLRRATWRFYDDELRCDAHKRAGLEGWAEMDYAAELRALDL